MASENDLLDALDELEGLLRLSSSIGDETFAEDRGGALQLRRRIAEQNAKIAALGESVFPTDEGRSRFRNQASVLRIAVTSHLSSWPISSIDVDDERYLMSLHRLRQAYRTFIASARDEVRRSRR